MFIVKNFSHFEARGKVYLPMSVSSTKALSDADTSPPPAAAASAVAAASTASLKRAPPYNPSNIAYNENFWTMFKPDGNLYFFRDLCNKALSIAKSNYIQLSKTTLNGTFHMFSSQKTIQQQEDMFISFAVVGILSKLFEQKCIILIKGKTGLFLCADILKKYGELDGVITDDIDLVILANQRDPDDPSRKIFARQVGLFISFCLNNKYLSTTRRDYRTVESAKIKPDLSDYRRYPIFVQTVDTINGVYHSSDVRIQGQGLCEDSFESKNVKVFFQPMKGRPFKIVDITYTTYHPEINRLYSRYLKVNINEDISYFYLDVRYSILEYVFILFNNVKKCNNLVKDKSTASTVGFMNMLTDFQQETLFKFVKSAYLCASIIRELPEFRVRSRSISKIEHTKEIVMMQLYELARRGIIPRKFTNAMIQTQDVLNTMLDEIVAQKADTRATASLDKPHQRLKTRLGAEHAPQKSWPNIHYDEEYAEDFPPMYKDDPFAMRTLIDEPLLSPDTSPTSQILGDDVVDVATTPAAANARRIYDNIKHIAKTTRRQKQPSIASASARPDSAAPGRWSSSSSARYRNTAKGGPAGNGGSKRRRRTLRKRLR